jgi:hypothetical protein
VKRLKASSEKLVFHLVPWEKQLLLKVLQEYPCIPPAHQRLSKSSATPEPKVSQELLDEALAEQRSENRRNLQTLLKDPHRFEKDEHGWRLALGRPEAEWLLQILNDVRVGSWLRLGSPEQLSDALTEDNAPDFWTMEMAGVFQAHLLEALHR